MDSAPLQLYYSGVCAAEVLAKAGSNLLSSKVTIWKLSYSSPPGTSNYDTKILVKVCGIYGKGKSKKSSKANQAKAQGNETENLLYGFYISLIKLTWFETLIPNLHLSSFFY